MQPVPPIKHPRISGIQRRAAIRTAIRAREAAGEPCPTLDELIKSLHMNKSTVRDHLKWMEDEHEIEYREATREVIRKEICLVRPANDEP